MLPTGSAGATPYVPRYSLDGYVPPSDRTNTRNFSVALTQADVFPDAAGGPRAGPRIPSDGRCTRCRAHWPGRRDVAGFLVTVRFESHGCLAYLRCVGKQFGRQARRLPAWPRTVGAGPAVQIERHFRQSDGGRHGHRRERILRHQTRGGLSRPIASHAGRLPCERRRTRLPPLRQSGAVSQSRLGRMGGESPGHHDGGGRQAGVRVTFGKGIAASIAPCRAISAVAFLVWSIARPWRLA